MTQETIRIPDIGGADGVEVIELCVAVGDTVAAEDSLVVLESDKASMEVPAPMAGKVVELLCKEGDTVSEGDELLILEVDGDADSEQASDAEPEAEESPAEDRADADAAGDKEQTPVTESSKSSAEQPSADGEPAEQHIALPDIGTDDAVEVIEVCISAGDDIAEGDSVVVLESDKASMEVPSPVSGTVVSVALSVGDEARTGDALMVVRTGASASAGSQNEAPSEPESEADAPKKTTAPAAPTSSTATDSTAATSSEGQGNASGSDSDKGAGIYAGPAVRKLAREFGIPLEKVRPSGPRGRVQKEDLHAYVKNLGKTSMATATGDGVPPIPEVDHAAFGEVSSRALSKMEKLTARNMHRSWLNVPHVTQFDDADVTDLEAFRQSLKAEAEQRGVKVTPLPFLLKASAAALRANPRFLGALHGNGQDMVEKDYVHIGMAVDTPAGLVVPVIRDVDQKSIYELSAEVAELADKAKQRKLKPGEMQGGCFTISSLGSLGGTGFTPIVNAPELAILGVSKLSVQPVWDGEAFQPRKLLPLTLSYDHRAINGADGGRFMTDLCALLGDVRRLIL